MSNITTEASPSTRAQVWFGSLTLVARGVLVVCSGVYLLGILTGWDDLGAVCLNPTPVLERWQVYRLLTSAIVHVGLLHLVFNMMAFLPIATSLERQLGSVQFLWLIGLLCVLGDALYIGISYLGAWVPISYVQDFRHQCAVGFSGVVFGLVVIDNAVSGATSRSIFGFFSVPARVYPWALLVFWQILVPQASFLGHLAGVTVGQLYVWGYLRWALLSSGSLQRVERSVLCARCYHSSGFIAHTGGGLGEQLPTTAPRGGSGGRGGALGGPLGSPTSRAGSGWLRGVWMPFPPNLNPYRALQEEAPPEPHQAPAGFTTGGAAASPDPKAAAAAAAEARMHRTAGGGSGGSGPASASAPNLAQTGKK